MTTIQIMPIGVIHNSVGEPIDQDWGKIISEIHVTPELAPGLQGLTDWSHIVVIYSMHRTTFDPAKHLVRRPRERADMPELGIFAQRGSHRPNTIGTTAVQLLGVENNIVRVRGLDAIDGTPVLDLKPYAPIYDGVREPLVPGWFIRLMQGYF